ncbi:hypothetical protein K8Z61_11035 [Nocardioides sp. TRM66260-LWL]|uniref:hypothetical protein n=1 Tax=Nocardioides sp. TRM66260-LWL TaxID=2874478 RepID=UPI001CC6F0D4|nr:hypothetical protein [Nocardioides sp. TRM66260-LWL]MBZ5735033.1 hypothetical protein [Nocardioides sp. TRM66260-LWL]
MPLTIHYLLVYSYSEQMLIREVAFTDAGAATVAYREAEEEFRGRSDHFEVVLLGADSRETIMKTHGHYFASTGTRDAFEDLLPSL